MSRVTREEVFAKAAELDAKGIRVGVIKVRELLGRGSYSTIQKFLEEWQADEPEIVEVPEVPEGVTGLLPTIWQACYQEAEKLFHTERSQLLEELKLLRNELASAQAATDALENDLEEAQKAKDRYSETVARLQSETEAQQRHIAKQDGIIEGLRSAIDSQRVGQQERKATEEHIGEETQPRKKTAKGTRKGQSDGEELQG